MKFESHTKLHCTVVAALDGWTDGWQVSRLLLVPPSNNYIIIEFQALYLFIYLKNLKRHLSRTALVQCQHIPTDLCEVPQELVSLRREFRTFTCSYFCTTACQKAIAWTAENLKFRHPLHNQKSIPLKRQAYLEIGFSAMPNPCPQKWRWEHPVLNPAFKFAICLFLHLSNI